MNFKKIIILAFSMIGSCISAGTVADQIQSVSKVLYDPLSPTTPTGLVQLVINANKPDYAEKLMTLGKTLFQASQIVVYTEQFVNNGLPKIEAAAARLEAEIKCDQAGKGKNICLADILKDFNEILKPVVNDLIASKSANALKQGEAEAVKQGKSVLLAAQFAPYDQGALLSLGSLAVIPADYRTKITTNVANFANQINGGMAFADTLRFLVNPEALFAAPTTEISDADKKLLQDSIKAEPVKIEVENLDF